MRRIDIFSMKGRNPNKEEKRWLDAISEFGCIICYNEHNVFSPASPHHIDGKTKEGAHFNTIPLCAMHHQVGGCNGACVARHPYKYQFEQTYGTEQELLEQMRQHIEG